MTKEENLDQVPFGDAIVPNGITRIASIFDFDSVVEVFTFLHACDAKKSTVEFLNETIVYTGNEDPIFNLRIALYMSVKANPKMAEDYIRWLISKEYTAK